MKPIKGLWAKLCLVLALAALGGCGWGETPGCAEDETLEVLQRILADHWGTMDQELVSFFGVTGGGSNLDLQLDLVTVKGRDETLDNYECSARLTINDGEHAEIVSYSVRADARYPTNFFLDVELSTQRRCI